VSSAATTTIDELLACPCCHRALTRTDGDRRCTACEVTYPALGGLPWLIPAPQATMGAWRLRLARLVTHLDEEAARIEAELADTTLAAKTRSRLKLIAGARRDHGRRLRALLAPLDPGATAAPEAMLDGFGIALPAGQDLASYYVNVHRDWAWGDEENRRTLDLVTRARGSHAAQHVLVLGAGAGRLAYDLHQAWSPTSTVAADLNPLLLLLAQRMFAGDSVELYEFPIAPRSSESCALLRRLAAPSAASAGLRPVFADAATLPFADAAFDVVVTPWLIDILDVDLDGVLAGLNRVLRPGGLWINTGPLVFARRQVSRQLGVEEVLDLAVGQGFARPDIDESEVPYMRSPASRHARLETVITFAARRIAPAPAVQAAGRPAWLEDERRPVPRTADVEFAAVSTRVQAFVYSLIDGRRSIEDIAAVLVEQRLMTSEDARSAIRTFMQRLHEMQSHPRAP
jgi:SAM-dependent methyltransferase